MSRLLKLPMVAQSLDYTCGAACYASMLQFFKNEFRGELSCAEELGVFEAGYTSPERIVERARQDGFTSHLIENAQADDLVTAVTESSRTQHLVVFVTWWDEDAGHYSLVRGIEKNDIVLMDPWTARVERDNRLSLLEFCKHWRVRGAKMILVRSDKIRGL